MQMSSLRFGLNKSEIQPGSILTLRKTGHSNIFVGGVEQPEEDKPVFKVLEAPSPVTFIETVQHTIGGRPTGRPSTDTYRLRAEMISGDPLTLSNGKITIGFETTTGKNENLIFA